MKQFFIGTLGINIQLALCFFLYSYNYCKESEFVKSEPKVLYKTRSDLEEQVIEDCAVLIKELIPSAVDSVMHLQRQSAKIVDAWAFSDETCGLKRMNLKAVETTKKIMDEMKKVLNTAVHEIQGLSHQLEMQLVTPVQKK